MHFAAQRCPAIPIIKYDLTKHPNYYLTGDCDKKNLFDIEKFLNRQMKLKPGEEYEVVNEDLAAKRM